MPETVTARERALSALNACWTFVAAGACPANSGTCPCAKRDPK